MDAHIRLFLPIPLDYNPKFKDWSYLSLRYLKAFDETKLPVKAITTTLGADLGNEESPFYSVAHLFTTPLVEKPLINIVLGFGGAFEKYHTAGMINIGLTVSYPRAQRAGEIEALKNYDHVWAGTKKTQDDLKDVGFDAEVVPPEPVIIKMLLNRITADELTREGEKIGN